MKRNVLRSQENYNKPLFNTSQLTIYVQFYERGIDFEARCIYKQDLFFRQASRQWHGNITLKHKICGSLVTLLTGVVV